MRRFNPAWSTNYVKNVYNFEWLFFTQTICIKEKTTKIAYPWISVRSAAKRRKVGFWMNNVRCCLLHTFSIKSNKSDQWFVPLLFSHIYILEFFSLIFSINSQSLFLYKKNWVTFLWLSLFLSCGYATVETPVKRKNAVFPFYTIWFLIFSFYGRFSIFCTWPLEKSYVTEIVSNLCVPILKCKWFRRLFDRWQIGRIKVRRNLWFLSNFRLDPMPCVSQSRFFYY